MQNKAKLFIEMDSLLGEGPIWHNSKGIYYWVDILGGILYAFDCNNKQLSKVYQSKYLSFVLETLDPEQLLISNQRELKLLDLKSNTVQTLSVVDRDKADNRFNDAKVDAKGRVWAGTMNIEAKANRGSLFCIERSNQNTRVLSNLTIPNGCIWSLDNRTMYFIDTAERAIRSYSYDYLSGQISQQKTVIVFDDFYPDGMTISSGGLLFVAMWGGACIHVIDPNLDQIVETISVDALHVTSCVFGGDQLDELFITTAKTGLSVSQLSKYPKSGSIFIYKSKHKGLIANKANIEYEK